MPEVRRSRVQSEDHISIISKSANLDVNREAFKNKLTIEQNIKSVKSQIEKLKESVKHMPG